MKEKMLPARVLHNEKLYKEFFDRHNIAGMFKPVTEQANGVLVNRRAISPYGYNPSIIQFGDRRLMAYRWHPQNNPKTSLAMAVIDQHFNVTHNQGIEIKDNLGSTEDPKLFIHQGELWLSYVDSTWPEMPPKCVVKYGKLLGNPWRVEERFQLEYGANDGTSTEKNFVFFEHRDKILCIYQCYPQHVVLEVDKDKVTKVHHSDGPRWAWGSIRGGTPPLPYKGKWLRFFHSGLDYDLAPNFRRYHVGALLMEPEPPFKVVKVSSEPIARGSEYCGLQKAESRACAHYKDNVVFPGGAIATDEGWLLACGVNDSQCVILRLTEKDLHI